MKLDSVDRCAIKELAFYKVTGHLAPGKDRPAVSGPDNEEEVAQIWHEWIDKHDEVIRRIFDAMELYLADIDDDDYEF